MGKIRKYMNKIIVYFGEQDIFSETLKKMVQIEGSQLFDFLNWKDCGEQFSDINPSFVFLDYDSSKLDEFPTEVKSKECVVFSTHDLNELDWNNKYYVHKKPLEVLQFREFLQDLLAK